MSKIHKVLFELCCTRAPRKTSEDTRVKFAPNEVVEFREEELDGGLKRKSVKCVTSTVTQMIVDDAVSGHPKSHLGAWRTPLIVGWWQNSTQHSDRQPTPRTPDSRPSRNDFGLPPPNPESPVAFFTDPAVQPEIVGNDAQVNGDGAGQTAEKPAETAQENPEEKPEENPEEKSENKLVESPEEKSEKNILDTE